MVGRESACSAGQPRIPRLRRYLGEGNSNPLQDSCLKNPHGQRSLVDYSPKNRKKLDTTEHTSTELYQKTSEVIRSLSPR